MYKKNYDIIFIPSQILGIGVLNCGIIVQKTIVVCLIVVWWQFWWQTNPISPSKMIYLSICYKSFYLDLWGFRVFGCDLIISPKPDVVSSSLTFPAKECSIFLINLIGKSFFRKNIHPIIYIYLIKIAIED